MISIVFVQQYGFFWKLTPDQWRTVCKEGVSGEGYDLPKGTSLRKRSPLIGVTDYGNGEGRPTFYPMRDDILVYSPLDWDPSDFEDALKDLDEKSAPKS